MDLWITEFSHHILAGAAIFRFQTDYVNYPFSMIFWALFGPILQTKANLVMNDGV